MHTTEQIIFAITAAGILGDAKRAAQSYDFGGLKFIIRAALDLPLDQSDWIRFGVLDDVAQAISN